MIAIAIQINISGINSPWIYYDGIRQRKWAQSGGSGNVSLKR